MKQSTLIVSIVLIVLVAHGSLNHAAAERVFWDVIAAGGTVESRATGYRMSGSLGQIGVEVLAGSTHTVFSGFWNPWLSSPVEVEDLHGFGMPTAYQLSQNYPNPFRAHTTVSFALPQSSRVSLEIYNLQGRMVRHLAQEAKEPGYYSVVWDGNDDVGQRAVAGVYVCRMIAQQAHGRAFAKSKSIVRVE